MNSFHDLRVYIDDAAWRALESLALAEKTDVRLLASRAVEQYAAELAARGGDGLRCPECGRFRCDGGEQNCAEYRPERAAA